MQRARLMENKIGALYRSGGQVVGGVYLGRGQEAFSGGLGVQLQKGKDIYAPLIRDQAGRVAFGEEELDFFRTYLGAAPGPMRGRDGNIHRGRPKEGLLAMISHLGSMVSVVAGCLLARRMAGRLGDAVGATSIGDGGTSTGAFHEALNLAAVEKLPLIVSVANNQFAYSTPNDRQFACETLVDRAKGYGVRGWSVDATDLAQCLKTFEAAVAEARAGGGPQLVEGCLLRLSGHGEHDDAAYVPDAIRHSRLGQDCLLRAEKQIVARGLASESEIEQWAARVQKEIDAVVVQVAREPRPDPYRERWEAFSVRGMVEGFAE
ncbi:MAG: thiamine pyrophosphate-dependent dehydrogenase E1 component subunit alpha [Verrucomicrobiales bacterium]|nr:thiamine pyrophosphate-dependent dehydrogenase E1 component subunit alpha [Verrucomicrobiales bacterium]